MNTIQIRNITKAYNGVTALDHVSFSFEFGKIYGFLGRNGAGKSTLINIIANRIFADSGEILIDDLPATENMAIHEKIFCMSEADLYDTGLKIKDHFKWIHRFYENFDLEKALKISEQFHLNTNLIQGFVKRLSVHFQINRRLVASCTLYHFRRTGFRVGRKSQRAVLQSAPERIRK